jgi:hypothetical protein
MDIEKLSKDDFSHCSRGYPTVRFFYKGVVMFNVAAVKHLKLYDKNSGYARVSVCHDKEKPGDFSVTCDGEGWQLRENGHGEAVFNSVGLARHVIDLTWERCSHAADGVKPRSWVFRIARLPLDDDKNKNVYALIRKK